MTATRVLGLLAVIAAFALLPASASAASFRLGGGPSSAQSLCGKTRTAVAVADGAPVFARVPSRVLRGPRVTRLVVDSCDGPKWNRMRRSRARTRTTLRLPAGDYRVRLRMRGRIRRVYARVGAGEVVDLPLSFSVRNTNTSRVNCPSDGAAYTVSAHLVAPRSIVDGGGPRAVTLYLHGLGYTSAYWHATDAPSYDYAALQARQGHASVVYDLLGRGGSGRPPGDQSCYGSQADVAHQIVGQLRSGGYRSSQRAPVSFGRVALASHSFNGFPAEIEAYSYRDIDALIITSFADGGQSMRTFNDFGRNQVICQSGGERSDGANGPGAYAFVSQTAEDFRSAMFFDADPAIAGAFSAGRVRDPCGETGSAAASTAVDQASLREITVPVLLVYGERDALYNQRSAGEQQAGLFSGTQDRSTVFLPDTGHALALERTAPRFRDELSRWLRARGF